MNILISGGCGFVGSNLSLYFKKKGHRVVAMDNLVRRGSEINMQELTRNGVTVRHGDIRNVEDFPTYMHFDFLLECSAQPSAIDGYKNPMFDFTNNTVGTMNCLEYCRKCGTSMIFWSTNKVYCGDQINQIPRLENKTRLYFQLTGMDFDSIKEGFPIDGGDHSIYGMTKAMSDLAVQEYYGAFGVKTIVNRFSCLYGPRQWGMTSQGWVSWWAIAAILGLPVTYIGWSGKQVRDCLFADDICDLIDRQMSMIDRGKGQVFNIGGGSEDGFSLSLIEATALVEKLTRKRMKVKIEKTPRKADHAIYISDITKAHYYFEWKPKVKVEEGYEKIIRWVRDNIKTLERMYC